MTKWITSQLEIRPYKTLLGAVFILLGMLCGQSVRAAEGVKLVLVYPGGEGDTQEAATLMGIFSDALSEQSGVKVTAEYRAQRVNPSKLNATAQTLVLMRMDSYLEWKDLGVKMNPVLATQPSFDEGPLVYHIYAGKAAGAAATKKPPCGALSLGVDLSARYLETLFGPEWKGVSLVNSDAPLEKLEEISKTPVGASPLPCILLESRQWQSLKAIPFPWKENLLAVGESSPTLQPMVFAFGAATTPLNDSLQKVVEALKKLSEVKSNQEMLVELQLKGFLPLNDEQRKTLGDWEKRYEATRVSP